MCIYIYEIYNIYNIYDIYYIYIGREKEREYKIACDYMSKLPGSKFKICELYMKEREVNF
jgi:hypothetical protein